MWLYTYVVDNTKGGGGSSAMRAVNSFIETQAQVIFPTGNRQKRLFDPPQSLLGAVMKEPEAAKCVEFAACLWGLWNRGGIFRTEERRQVGFFFRR